MRIPFRRFIPFLRHDFERIRRRWNALIENPTLAADATAEIEQSKFGRYNSIGRGATVNHTSLGDRTYLAEGAMAVAAVIGKFSSIGPFAIVGLAAHPLGRFTSTHPAFHLSKMRAALVDRDCFEVMPRVSVGNDVWIGAHALIRAGVTVHDGAVIGAGAVVTHDVPPFAVCVGVPARIKSFRFDSATVERLLHLRWWDQDDAWLKERAHLFYDVSLFLDSAV